MRHTSPHDAAADWPAQCDKYAGRRPGRRGCAAGGSGGGGCLRLAPRDGAGGPTQRDRPRPLPARRSSSAHPPRCLFPSRPPGDLRRASPSFAELRRAPPSLAARGARTQRAPPRGAGRRLFGERTRSDPARAGEAPGAGPRGCGAQKAGGGPGWKAGGYGTAWGDAGVGGERRGGLGGLGREGRGAAAGVGLGAAHDVGHGELHRERH